MAIFDPIFGPLVSISARWVIWRSRVLRKARDLPFCSSSSDQWSFCGHLAKLAIFRPNMSKAATFGWPFGHLPLIRSLPSNRRWKALGKARDWQLESTKSVQSFTRNARSNSGVFGGFQGAFSAKRQLLVAIIGVCPRVHLVVPNGNR